VRGAAPARARGFLWAALTAAILGCPGSGVVPSLERAGLDSLIGRQWRGDSAPASGLVPEAGWLVAQPDSGGARFGFHLFSAGDRRLVTLSREAGRAAVHAVWTTTDAMWLPRPPDEYRLVTSCQRDGVSDPRLFAIVRTADAPWLTEVRQAWIADTVTGRIETADPAGIRCANEDWGA
jgi:hypothetical protein